MASYKDSFGGDTFKAADQEENWSVKLTIIDVGEKTYEDRETKVKETKLLITFKEHEQKLVCNWTNAEEIGLSYGEDTDGWVGKQIQLYRTMVRYGAKMVPAIRVRGPKTAAAVPPPVEFDVPEDAPGDPGPTRDGPENW